MLHRHFSDNSTATAPYGWYLQVNTAGSTNPDAVATDPALSVALAL
jgi:hypothetical protein